MKDIKLAVRDEPVKFDRDAPDYETFPGHIVQRRRDTDPRHRKRDLEALAAVQAARPLKPPTGRPPERTTRAAELALVEDERKGVLGDLMAVRSDGAVRTRSTAYARRSVTGSKNTYREKGNG